MRRLLCASAVALGLTACAGGGYYDTAYDPYYGGPAYGQAGYAAPPPPGGIGTGTAVGALGGAAAGGFIGSQIGEGTGNAAATIGGVLLGGLLGGTVGQGFDQRQRVAAQRAQERAFASNTAATWGAPGADYHGQVQPLRTYYSNGRLCREYVHTVYIAGRAEQARGTACQLADGTWQVVG